MRIYNAKNSQLDLPLSGNARITIGGKTVSKDILPSEDFLTMIAQTFEADEIALIVGGPWEINLCAKNPACNALVVQSLDEAIARFSEVKPEPAPVMEKIQEPVHEEVKTVVEAVAEEASVIDSEVQFPEEGVEETEESTEAVTEPGVVEPVEEEDPAPKATKKGGNKKNKKH